MLRGQCTDWAAMDNTRHFGTYMRYGAAYGITIDNSERSETTCHRENEKKKTKSTEIQLTDSQILFSCHFFVLFPILIYFFLFYFSFFASLFVHLFKPNHDQLINTRQASVYRVSNMRCQWPQLIDNKSVAARTLWNSKRYRSSNNNKQLCLFF